MNFRKNIEYLMPFNGLLLKIKIASVFGDKNIAKYLGKNYKHYYVIGKKRSNKINFDNIKKASLC